jgi:DNA-binding MarR family transcriptional regulator
MAFKIDHCIFFQLAKASQVGARYWTSCVAQFKLTAVQAMVLGFLGQKDEVTAAELGKRTYLDSATLTGVLDRLESARIIKRIQHPDDRRAIHICLTDEGRGLAENVTTRGRDANIAFLSTLSEDEQATLHALLDKVRSSAAVK